MTRCGFAGGCPNPATATVRIAGIGDRGMCNEHLAWITQAGMDFRVLDPNAPVPVWRRQDLRRDMSGSLR